MPQSASAKRAPASAAQGGRVDVFAYHDYRAFLKDWVTWRKTVDGRFSWRELARRAGLGNGYLSSVVSGSQKISLRALSRLVPHLDLTAAEARYLENLVRLCTSESQEVREIALHQMKTSVSYRRKNPSEAELIEYMSHWHYIAIRELAARPDFQMEPEWIRLRLKENVTIKEIRRALDFLVAKGYIVVSDGNVAVPTKEELRCVGGVYKTALTQYHREMFTLAAKSIDNTPASERKLLGYTMAIEPESYEKAQRILVEAVEKIAALAQSGAPEKAPVYHVELALFPLTKREGAV